MDDMQLQDLVSREDGMGDDIHRKALAFYIEETLYSFPLVNVLEIIGVQAIASVPGTPAYVKGVINLRGGIVPVVDLRLKFGKEERAYDDQTSIVVTVFNNVMVGVIVDRVLNVVFTDGEGQAELPEFSNVNTNRYMTSVSRVEGKLLMNLDCETILEDDNILHMV